MSKYKAKKTIVDGITFDSRKEANRYSELKILNSCGKIESLELQPRYDVRIKDKFICFYKSDFRYKENGRVVVEDVKGVKTPVYRLKKKLVEALYEITITEI